jgi:hypothetical protein
LLLRCSFVGDIFRVIWQALKTISHLILDPGAHSAFLHIDVQGIIRLPDTRVLVFTPAGRFVITGTNVEAASGDLTDMNTSELLSAVAPTFQQRDAPG